MKISGEMKMLAVWWTKLNHGEGVPGIHMFSGQDWEAQRFGQWAMLDAIPGVRAAAIKIHRDGLKAIKARRPAKSHGAKK